MVSIVSCATRMSSQPQHKQKTLMRNLSSLSNPNAAFGAPSSSNDRLTSGSSKPAIAIRTQQETESSLESAETPLQQREDRRIAGSDIPDAAHSLAAFMDARGPAFPHSPPAHVNVLSSYRRNKKGKEKGVSDDHRSQHSHPPRRHSHGTPAHEVAEKDKNSRSAEKHALVGPLASAEFERIKREVETLKKTVHDQKKMMKKQYKVIEELRNELTSDAVALTEKDTKLFEKDEELRKLRDKIGTYESSVSSIESTFQCQICMEMLYRPYALPPCGHVFCLLCLQEWFRKAPTSDYDDNLDGAAYVLYRPKTCPCCRADVTHRPVPLFIVRAATQGLGKIRAQLSGSEFRSGSPILDGEEDPWKGIFRSSDDEEESTSGGELSYETDDAFSDNIELESDSGNGSESEFDGGSNDGEEDGEEDAAYGSDFASQGIYARPRWQPASDSAFSYEDEDDDGNRILSLLPRGCPLRMISKFHMIYSPQEGIVAHVPYLNPEIFIDDIDIDVGMMNRVFLGWNIHVSEHVDRDGQMYLQRALEELAEYPERWEIRPRHGAPAAYDAIRLVRLRAGIEEYESGLTYTGDVDSDYDGI
ncbi:hypothetical protein AX17_002768 [Amanita inopinata Kibby_2008]|nr:hypothetical protein AX17_002768 [Amanita inopinata Kibby_2008]